MARDESWRSIKRGRDHGHERLEWARRQSDFQTKKDFAESVGMKAGTYNAYERALDSSKHTPLDDQAAIRFGRKLKVKWEWLLTGDGSPWPDEDVERISRAVSELPDGERKAKVEAILALLRTGTGG